MNPADIENRFTYHPATPGQAKLYETIRDGAKALAEFVNESCPDGREKSLAITHLEETVFWANASIARQQGDTR